MVHVFYGQQLRLFFRRILFNLDFLFQLILKWRHILWFTPSCIRFLFTVNYFIVVFFVCVYVGGPIRDNRLFARVFIFLEFAIGIHWHIELLFVALGGCRCDRFLVYSTQHLASHILLMLGLLEIMFLIFLILTQLLVLEVLFL